jgi:hypothetical protein
LAVEKSNHFDTASAAQKKLALALVRACGPNDSRGSNSFLLNPPREASKWRFFQGHLTRGLVLISAQIG